MTLPSDTGSSREIRQSINRQRRLLDATEIASAAINLKKNLCQLAELRRAKDIGCYISVNGEADPGLFVATAWARQKRIFMPVLRKNGMSFYELSPDDELRKNAFGIPEPLCTNAKLLNAKNLHAILVPLVAFDGHGNRLGMGGGYYDRLLAFTKHRLNYRRPLLIGLAYDFQRVEQLTTNSWDIPLHAVVTDKNTYKF
jgi:5-formyltetrahydrofolate cyclo-ligase